MDCLSAHSIIEMFLERMLCLSWREVAKKPQSKFYFEL